MDLNRVGLETRNARILDLIWSLPLLWNWIRVSFWFLFRLLNEYAVRFSWSMFALSPATTHRKIRSEPMMADSGGPSSRLSVVP